MENDESSFLALSEEMALALRAWHAREPNEADQDEAADSDNSDEARQLLRALNNLPSIEAPLEEFLEEDEPELALAKADHLSQLVNVCARKFKRARKQQPELAADPSVESAAEAMGAMAHAVIEYTLALLPAQHAQAKTLKEWLLALPAQAAQRQAQSAKRLLDTITTGMERISGKNISGKTAPERLTDASGRIQATARTLQSVDTLKPPAREESIELAREILRRLKNMAFSDKTLKVLIDGTNTQDKMAFAEQIDELTDAYTNLLQEAAEIDPAILQDQDIRDAADAVSTFSHGVKLMAAKEMPGSVAAAQQISADATHNPEEWAKLNNRTVGRLVKSMEGALEKAAGGIEVEQEAQRKQEEQQQQQGQEAAEAGQQGADQSRRKRRRRRSPRSSSGAGTAKKQSKDKQAFEAEEYVIKQGRFGRDSKSARSGIVSSPLAQTPMVAPAAAPMPGLSADALAAVKQLGGALFKVSKQAKDIGEALKNVPPTEKIQPDKKTAAQRVVESELQKGPRNQGPRV